MLTAATNRILSSASSKHASCTLFSVSRWFSKERAGKSIRPGCAIILENQPHRCSKIIQGKRGKGGGFIKATLKNLITGNSYEKTFTSDEMVEHADLERKAVSYSWADDLNYIFMDLETYEEVVLPQTEVELGHFLVAGLELKVQYFRDAIIGVELPMIIEYKVATRPIDGSKAPNDFQPATLEGCSATVMVPDFVREGTRIRVNVTDGEYLDRVM